MTASPSRTPAHDAALIRVILVDDHELVRSGLAALLAQVPDMRVVAEARDGASLLALLEHTRAEVLVCDIGMPGMDGLETIERVHSQWPELRILVLSMEDSPQVARRALGNGASGYVVKNAASSELQEAIRATMAGLRYLSPVITRSLLVPPSGAAQEQLTTRQLEILTLIAEGCTSREIGIRLGLSHKTVDVHRLRIMDRLGIRDVASLTRYALRHRLVV
ncbi:response regulator [Ramlibacter sp. MMS24-I3-19]|uniref:response regulator n=1 Tax=Ramlibacter sp. MMS24-I3-19 TaxID=3416606 RepID=UPI003D064836